MVQWYERGPFWTLRDHRGGALDFAITCCTIRLNSDSNVKESAACKRDPFWRVAAHAYGGEVLSGSRGTPCVAMRCQVPS